MIVDDPGVVEDPPTKDRTPFRLNVDELAIPRLSV
jgi:hypothetical protein